ncbi:uncharacterized protein [Diadema antillarum]|uniref:uncharacterized protein n=1 Tax=Diadema antillarum TaxID=105358 RepID=UPI003A8BDF82
MMVTAMVEPGEEVPTFETIVGRLQGKHDGGSAEDRTAVYQAISNWFKESEARVLGSDSLDLGPLVQQFSTDVMADDGTMVQAALEAMGFCLYLPDTVGALTDENSGLVVKALCNCVLKTEDKSVCTRALWCLAKQNLKPHVLVDEVHPILCCVEKALQAEGSAKSMTVQHESINVIIRLNEQLPDVMAPHAARWGKVLLPNVAHTATKIRERAVHGVQTGLVAMTKCQAELVPSLVSELKGPMLRELMKLFRARHEHFVLRVWGYFVTILGKTLHRGGSIINQLLSVIEQGFKHPQPEVKRAAFQTWQALIDNFSLDLDILSNAKRLKLLMQPFLATSVKAETVAHAKLDAWWHLVRSLGSRLPSTFQVVCIPLLQYTLGFTPGAPGVVTPSKAGGAAPSIFNTPQSRAAMLPGASPITPRLNLATRGGVSSQASFPSVQRRGVHMLAAFMDVTVATKEGSAPIDVLSQRLLTSPSVFSKLAALLTPCVLDSLCMVDEEIGDLPLRIFESLVGQVRGVLEGPSKRDSLDVFTLFIDHLTFLVNSKELPPATVLKLFDAVSLLPKKVLSSSSYHTGSAGVLHGTPALFLIELLFSPSVLISCAEERFFTVLMRLVGCGMGSATTVLGFTQSVVAILDKVADAITNKECLWRMWSILAEPLLQYIVQTNEVNQGDSLEHDFSAVVVCLLFPVQRLLPHNLPQPTVKTLLKLWSELYEAFARSASLVTVAEGNQCCEDVCAKLLTLLDDSALGRWHFVDVVGQVCQVMSHNIDSLLTVDAKNPGTPHTPGRKAKKKKNRPLGNLTSLVNLVSHVTLACANLCEKQTGMLCQPLAQTDLMHWSSAVQSLTAAMGELCQINVSTYLQACVSKFSQPLAKFMKNAVSPVFTNKDYLATIEDKVERLWVELTTTVQTSYGGEFDSAFLAIFAPALEAAFTYKKRSLRNYTLVFWMATFGKEKTLEYPDVLLPCLGMIKERSDIALPNWKEAEINADTPMSQETEASQTMMAPPVIPNFGGPSPQKMHGSFLHRTAEAKKLMVASSPVKTELSSPGRGRKSVAVAVNSPGVGKRKQFASPAPVDVAKRKLHVDEDSKLEFVVISSSPSKKRVLTEHQKEVLKTKRVSLALYNDLEQSLDVETFQSLTQTQSQPVSPVHSESGSTSSQDKVSSLQFSFPKESGSPSSSSKKESADEVAQGKMETSEGQGRPINEKEEAVTDERVLQSSQQDHSENAQRRVATTKEDVSDQKVAQSSQDSSQKACRRVVTFFQPVAKSSSPLKDAGRLDTESSANGSNDGAKRSDYSVKEILLPEQVENESSAVLIEDSCLDQSVEEIAPQTDDATEVEMKDVDDPNDIFDVPETQEEPKGNESVVDVSDDAIPLSVAESPTEDEKLEEDPQDFPLDDRFKKVVSTPVIKLQKLSERVVKQYTPRLVLNSSVSSEESADECGEGGQAGMEGRTDSVSKGASRLRKCLSDETNSLQVTPKRKRKLDDVSGTSKSRSDAEKRDPCKDKKAAEVGNLQASQRDLAELAERYELDGIAPLVDDLDQSVEESSNICRTDNEVDEAPPVLESCDSQARNDSEEIPLLENINASKNLDGNEIGDVIASQPELFSNVPDQCTVGESLSTEPDEVVRISSDLTGSGDSSPSRKDAASTAGDKSEPSFQQTPGKRKRGRPRKNAITGDRVGDSQCSQDDTQLSVNTEEAQNEVGNGETTTVGAADGSSQVKRKRGRPRKSIAKGNSPENSQNLPMQDSKSGLSKNLDRIQSAEKEGTPRKRGRPRKSVVQKSASATDEARSQTQESETKSECNVTQASASAAGEAGKQAQESKTLDVVEQPALNAVSIETKNESDATDKDSQVESGPKASMDLSVEEVKDKNESGPECNSSSEDLFGTCTLSSSPKVQEEQQVECGRASIEYSQASLNESFASEDDVPLVQLKKSLDCSSHKEGEESMEVEDRDDSEVDFPIMTPNCRDDKFSAESETPPKEVLADRLASKTDSPKVRGKNSQKDDVDVIAITRSGRKCKPSARIKCAKDILRKVLRSPEDRKRAAASKSVKSSVVSPAKISPKLLRSFAAKAPKTNNVSREDRQDVPCTPDSSGINCLDDSLEEQSRVKDLSAYQISPQSLQSLAEKITQDLSPESTLSPPTFRSARKAQRSPKTSPLSSQMLRGCRTGRVTKTRDRSKSPISQRLRSKRSCITPGPLQTRSGNKLSRVHFKKRHQKRHLSEKAAGHTRDEREVKDMAVAEEVNEDAVTEVEKKEFCDSNIIVIADSMSQGEDVECVIPDELANASRLCHQGEAIEAIKELPSCKGAPQNELENGLSTSEQKGMALSQTIDEDGDVTMQDVEEEASPDLLCEMAEAEILQSGRDGSSASPRENAVAEVIAADISAEEEQVIAADISAEEEQVIAADIAAEEEQRDNEKVGLGFYATDSVNAVEEVKPQEPTSADPAQPLSSGKDGVVDNSQRLESAGDSSAEQIQDSEKEGDSIEECMTAEDDDANRLSTNVGETAEKEVEEVEKADSVESSPEDTADSGEVIVDSKAKSDRTDEVLESDNGAMVGVMSSGLDIQETEEDIVNSSQSPLKMQEQVDESPPQAEPAVSLSPRLSFPSLTTPNMDGAGSPDKPKVAETETQPFQVSPIIPTKFSPRVQGSPEGASMRPPWACHMNSPEGSIPHIYSPTASPSSGILKNRDGPGSNSPSPSSKNRRVSFAEKVFIEPEPLNDGSSSRVLTMSDASAKSDMQVDADRRIFGHGSHPPSPLVTMASSRVVTHNSKFITTPSKGGEESPKSSLSSSFSSSQSLSRLRRKSPLSSRRLKSKLNGKSALAKSSYASKVLSMVSMMRPLLMTPTQGSLTQGSPTSQVDSCNEALEESQGPVYPALVDCSLPVDSVLPQLTSSMWYRGLGKLFCARNIRTIGDLCSLSAMEVQSLPIKSPKIAHLKKVLSAFQDEKFPDQRENSANSGDQSSESQTGEPGDGSPSKASALGNLSPPRSPQQVGRGNLVGRLGELVTEFHEGALDSLPALELFQAHAHVNKLMDGIVGALKTKCHSPSMDKDA